MMKSLRHLLRNKKGATAFEYGIMVAAIAAVFIATVFVVGGQVDAAFTAVETDTHADILLQCRADDFLINDEGSAEARIFVQS